MLNKNRLAVLAVMAVLLVAVSGCLGIACSCPNGDETNGDNGDNGDNGGEETARIIFGSLRDAPSSPDHPDYEDFSGAYYKYSELYTMKADGSDVQRITDNKYYEMQADVSPDGSKIVCSIHYSWEGTREAVDPGWEIAVMDIDGTNLTNLTNNDYLDVAAHWNHDGTKIVYLSDSAHRTPDEITAENYVPIQMDVYTMDADGGNVTQLTSAEPGEIYSDPSFSFSEPSRILYIHDEDSLPPQNTDLYVMDADGENKELILRHDEADRQAIAINDPMFSPDGSTIIFEAEMGVNEWDHVIYHMFTVDASGENVRKITQGGMEVSEGIPQFSPDGTKIAYDRVVWTSATVATREIWLANADGSDEERLSSYPHGIPHEMEPSWIPVADDG